MKQLLGNRSSELRETLHSFLKQTRFARATELALSHRFIEAEALLMANGIHALDADELDLLARIAAQQGKYERARNLWETALKNSPNKQVYHLQLLHVDAAEATQKKRRRIAYIVLAVAACVCLSWLVMELWTRMFPEPAGSVTSNQHSENKPDSPLYGPWLDPASYERKAPSEQGR